MTSTITNQGGQFRSADGPEAVKAFGLRQLMIGLRFEARTGMKMSRGVSLKATAKRLTGLKTNNALTLAAAVEVLLAETLEKCEIVDDGNASVAYRSYLICRAPLSNTMWVEKGGSLIQHVADGSEARRVIDSLMDQA